MACTDGLISWCHEGDWACLGICPAFSPDERKSVEEKFRREGFEFEIGEPSVSRQLQNFRIKVSPSQSWRAKGLVMAAISQMSLNKVRLGRLHKGTAQSVLEHVRKSVRSGNYSLEDVETSEEELQRLERVYGE